MRWPTSCSDDANSRGRRFKSCRPDIGSLMSLLRPGVGLIRSAFPASRASAGSGIGRRAPATRRGWLSVVIGGCLSAAVCVLCRLPFGPAVAVNPYGQVVSAEGDHAATQRTDGAGSSSPRHPRVHESNCPASLLAAVDRGWMPRLSSGATAEWFGGKRKTTHGQEDHRSHTAADSGGTGG